MHTLTLTLNHIRLNLSRIGKIQINSSATSENNQANNGAVTPRAVAAVAAENQTSATEFQRLIRILS